MPKHYAIADIHGMYNIYEQVCDKLQPDDVVYFLGDAADRGYACLKTMEAIYNNPQWIYLKGNHEDMMAKALRYMETGDMGDSMYDPIALWYNNGGYNTHTDYLNEENPQINYHILNRLPVKTEYTNEKGITFILTHAGCTLGKPETMWGEELIWSRNHFFHPWDEEKYPNHICIHGHTPMPVFVKKLKYVKNHIEDYDPNHPEARKYCNGHKINIDNAVFYTGGTVLYDLDEMEAIPLFDKNFNKED